MAADLALLLHACRALVQLDGTAYPACLATLQNHSIVRDMFTDDHRTAFFEAIQEVCSTRRPPFAATSQQTPPRAPAGVLGSPAAATAAMTTMMMSPTLAQDPAKGPVPPAISADDGAPSAAREEKWAGNVMSLGYDESGKVNRARLVPDQAGEDGRPLYTLTHKTTVDKAPCGGLIVFTPAATSNYLYRACVKCNTVTRKPYAGRVTSEELSHASNPIVETVPTMSAGPSGAAAGGAGGASGAACGAGDSTYLE